MPSDPMWTDSILIDSSYSERSDSSVVTDDNLLNNTDAFVSFSFYGLPLPIISPIDTLFITKRYY